MDSVSFFDKDVVREGQVRFDGRHYIVVSNARGVFGEEVRGAFCCVDLLRPVRLASGLTRWGYMTDTRNIARDPIVGSFPAVCAIGLPNEAWVETARAWRWERSGVGAVQKQRRGDYTMERWHGEDIPGRAFTMSAARRAVWEVQLAETTRRLLDRPRSGALATPETFHAVARAR